MNISYKWLKDYIDIDLTPDQLSAILTQIGLETGSIEEVETIRGGLRGLVVGKVLTCEKHPDSDHLSKTTVDVGNGQILPMVCGAPNVAAGQKVIVATVGATLYDGDKEFQIRKSKIRGEVSEGMICAEDEIGIGTDHSGIIVLPDSAQVGTPAGAYFGVESDYRIEVDLTPNRIDSASHIGVARDLAAFLSKTNTVSWKKPSVDGFSVDDHALEIAVEVENYNACRRYSGLSVTGVQIGESPDWLKNRLRAIGLSPINNVVDISNYVLFETGQPLHTFDADEITGKKVVVKTLPAGEKFTTLDQVERELHPDDLMICNSREGMCIAGVFGGVGSGIKETTRNIFIESACFDPVYVRKTARRHGLNTDASFRFERGTDPNGTVYALKRASMLIREIAGGKISSEITDLYPAPVEDFKVDVTYAGIKRLIGKDIGADRIKGILHSLEIKIDKESKEGLSLAVPPYRVDVKREADIVEEILRIYGYNNVEIPQKVNASLQYRVKPDPVRIREMMAAALTAQGFHEIWSNSLTKSAYYENCTAFPARAGVKLFNPLSADLSCMRQTLLFGGLEALAYNANRKNSNLRLYEIGNCYFRKDSELTENPLRNYWEEEHLALFVTGRKEEESWTLTQADSSFFQLKGYVENLLTRLGFPVESLKQADYSNDLITAGLSFIAPNGKKLAEAGVVQSKLLRKFGIDQPVFHADFSLDQVIPGQKNNKTGFSDLPRFPEVRRDLALLLNKDIRFSALRELAFRTERKLLRKVGLFDVYEGKGIPDDKKSYAVSFILRDDERTLQDNQIDRIMQKLIATFEKELGAQLR
jgi:phenylalanyl-tRNA synthetase beta chain